jgi:hypothetical protein
MHVTRSDLDLWFNEHRPTVTSLVPERNAKLREGAKAFAEVVLEVTRPCPEQAATLALIRLAMFSGLDAIACEE